MIAVAEEVQCLEARAKAGSERKRETEGGNKRPIFPNFETKTVRSSGLTRE